MEKGSRWSATAKKRRSQEKKEEVVEREGRLRIHRRSPLCENKSDTNRRNALTCPVPTRAILHCQVRISPPLSRERDSFELSLLSVPTDLENELCGTWRTSSRRKKGSETRVSHARHASRWHIGEDSLDAAARLRRVTRRNDPIMVPPRFYRPLSFVIIANSRRTAEKELCYRVNGRAPWPREPRHSQFSGCSASLGQSPRTSRGNLATVHAIKTCGDSKIFRPIRDDSASDPIRERFSFLLRRTSTTAGFKYLFQSACEIFLFFVVRCLFNSTVLTDSMRHAVFPFILTLYSWRWFTLWKIKTSHRNFFFFLYLIFLIFSFFY